MHHIYASFFGFTNGITFLGSQALCGWTICCNTFVDPPPGRWKGICGFAGANPALLDICLPRSFEANNRENICKLVSLYLVGYKSGRFCADAGQVRTKG